MILDKIIENKKRQIEKSICLIPEKQWLKQIEKACKNSPRDFKKALKGKNALSIIGEIKKASPSKGIIRMDFAPVEIAKQYEKAGIDAVSVLTEKSFFSGHEDYLKNVSKKISMPVLRKDFIIDKSQIYESRLIGADAVLLIAAALSTRELKELYTLVKQLKMAALIEVHDRNELEAVLEINPGIIGINNRNLMTFDVDINVTKELIEHIPEDICVVSESGINSYSDMKFLKNIGADAVLIGEAFMKAEDIIKKVTEFKGER